MKPKMTPQEKKQTLQLFLVTTVLLIMGILVIWHGDNLSNRGDAMRSVTGAHLSARGIAVPTPLLFSVRDIPVSGQSFPIMALTSIRCANDLCSLHGSVHILDTSPVISGMAVLHASPAMPIVLYHDISNLKAAVCMDANCMSATLHVLDTGIASGYDTDPVSAVLDPTGKPIIAYYDAGNQDLKVAHCVDVQCSSATKTTVDSDGNTGMMPVILMGSNHLPIIFYKRTTGTGSTAFDSVVVAACTNLDCTTTPTSAPDIFNIQTGHGNKVGPYIAAVLGPNGWPWVAIYAGDYGGGRPLVIHCTSPTCNASSGIPNTHIVLGTALDDGRYPAILIGEDGLPIIFYQLVLGFINGISYGYNLKTAHCLNADCAQVIITHFPNTELFGYYLAVGRNPVTGSILVIGQNSHNQSADSDLFAMNCTDSTCSQMTPPIIIDDPATPPTDIDHKAMANAMFFL